MRSLIKAGASGLCFGLMFLLSVAGQSTPSRAIVTYEFVCQPGGCGGDSEFRFEWVFNVDDPSELAGQTIIASDNNSLIADSRFSGGHIDSVIYDLAGGPDAIDFFFWSPFFERGYRQDPSSWPQREIIFQFSERGKLEYWGDTYGFMQLVLSPDLVAGVFSSTSVYIPLYTADSFCDGYDEGSPCRVYLDSFSPSIVANYGVTVSGYWRVVPEPATLGLFGLGLAGLGIAARRRRTL